MFDSIIPGSRASLIFDVIVLSMPIVLLALGYSLYQVKYHRNVALHKRLQLALSVILLIVITWFELDVRFFGWKERAALSPYYNTTLFPFLYGHVLISVSAAGAWLVQVLLALRQFDKNYEISVKNRISHIRRGWLTVVLMILTTVTGWIFYVMAFIATS